MMIKKIHVALNNFFRPRQFRSERTMRARNVVAASVLTLAFGFVGIVGFETAALAASAGGNDPAAGTFATHCATCHAENGSGDTPVGKSVKIPDLRSPAIQSQSDAQMTEIIAKGKGAMPGFGSSLSKDEIAALVKHVHGLAKAK
jgi:mono/diheme cytochrome c family protein